MAGRGGRAVVLRPVRRREGLPSGPVCAPRRAAHGAEADKEPRGRTEPRLAWGFGSPLCARGSWGLLAAERGLRRAGPAPLGKTLSD